MSRDRAFIKELASVMLPLVFFLYAFLLCLKPLADPDLWWHLKTGQWIIENRALPGEGGEDPFSYSLPKPLHDNEVKGLRSQWLGQVVFYAVFSIGGYRGLSVFRALLIVLPFIYMYWRFQREGANPLPLLLVLGFPPLFISSQLFYAFERPQVFSFYFTLAVFLLLRRLRAGRGGWLFLPVLMLLWANLHGGYMVGAAVIMIYAGGEALGLLARRFGIRAIKSTSPSPQRFFAVCGISLLATGINPGGYRILSGWILQAISIFRTAKAGDYPSIVLADVLEYKPLWFFYTEFHYSWPVYLGAFFLLALASLAMKYITCRRLELPEALVCLSVFIFGLYYAKGINFTIIFLSFTICAAFLALKGRKRALVIPVLAALIIASMLVDIGRTTSWKLRPKTPKYWIDASYPEGAVRFIKEHKVGGNMFNDMRWGGYLTWRLHPGHKVFIDGRSVSSSITGLYLAVIKGEPASWSILDTFDINFMVLPVMSKENGVISPLMPGLTRKYSARWKLVYLWDNAAVFVRDNRRNAELIECCSIPISEIYREVIAISDLLLTMIPGHPEALLSKAIAFYELKMYLEAKQILLNLPTKTLISSDLLEKLKDY
jgi:hypothetical protein